MVKEKTNSYLSTHWGHKNNMATSTLFHASDDSMCGINTSQVISVDHVL